MGICKTIARERDSFICPFPFYQIVLSDYFCLFLKHEIFLINITEIFSFTVQTPRRRLED